MGGNIGGGARANDAKGLGAGPVTWRTLVRHGDTCRDAHLDRSLLGFIEGDPELDSVPELCEAQPGILLKAVRHLTALLAFLTLQGLGQVPVHYVYPGGHQCSGIESLRARSRPLGRR